MEGDYAPNQELVVIPHKHRPERRAVWRKGEKKITYEYLIGPEEWRPDYTIWESQVDAYFQEFYGFPK